MLPAKSTAVVPVEDVHSMASSRTWRLQESINAAKLKVKIVKHVGQSGR